MDSNLHLVKHHSVTRILVLAFVAVQFSLYAQPGANDPTFSSFMTRTPPGTSIKIIVQPDGKILHTLVTSSGQTYLARLNSDGSHDKTFSMKPVAGGISDFNLLGDGKILVGINESSYSGFNVNGLIRLNANGTFDKTFSSPQEVSALGWEGILVQSDNKIIGGTNIGIRRLNVDGTFDRSFTPPELFGRPSSLQSDGKIIVISPQGTLFARLNANGTIDNSFDTGEGISGSVYTTTIQPNGKILIGGGIYSYNGIARAGLARVNANGTLDNTFNPGTTFGDVVHTITQQHDGKILIGGTFTTYDGASRITIARINANGSLDNTFNPSFPGTLDIELSPLTGKIIVASNLIINSIDQDSKVDQSFRQRTGFDGVPQIIRVQSDGSIYAMGVFTSYNNILYNGFVRLTSDGLQHHDFNPGSGADATPIGLSIQSDDKVIITGSFTTYNGISRPGIARLNPDASLDATFDPGTGTDGMIASQNLQEDGSIIIQGSFNKYNGAPVTGGVAKVTSTGQLDNSLAVKSITYTTPEYNPDTGEPTGNIIDKSTYASMFALLPENKLMLAGSFDKYNGIVRNRLVVINSDGMLDESFDPGASVTSKQSVYDPVSGEETGTIDAPGYISSIASQADGKVLIIGSFDKYNGTPVSGFIRINTNGSLDTGFNPDLSLMNVSKIYVLSNGQIMVTGGFSAGIVRLNTDGSLDNTFNAGSGADGSIEAMAEQADDGKLLIGGNFKTYYGIDRNGIARIQMFIDAGCSAFGVTPEELPAANLDTEFSQAFVPVEGTAPYTFSIISGELPEGFVLSAGGVLSGTPVLVDTTSFVLQVSDAEDCVITKSYSLQVSNKNCSVMTIDPDVLPEVLPEKAYSQSLIAEGGKAPYTFKIISGTLPQGFSLDNSGLLSGATSTLGAFELKLQVQDARNCVNAEVITLPVGVSCNTFLFPQVTLPTPAEGQLYKHDLIVSGGKEPYAYLLSHGALPLGLSLNPRGRISGIPSEPGQVTFTVTAKDLNNCRVSQTFTACVTPIVEITPALSNGLASYSLQSSRHEGNQWFKNGEPIPGATSPTLEITSMGAYFVQVTVNGCTGSSNESTLTDNEMERNSIPLQIFPIPAGDKISVVYSPLSASSDVEASIYNTVGKKLIEEVPMQRNHGEWSAVLMVNSLPAGYYIIHINTGENSVVKSFIKR
jgi:uncharacterized delta-60 repeat protein